MSDLQTINVLFLVSKLSAGTFILFLTSRILLVTSAAPRVLTAAIPKEVADLEALTTA